MRRRRSVSTSLVLVSFPLAPRMITAPSKEPTRVARLSYWRCRSQRSQWESLVSRWWRDSLRRALCRLARSLTVRPRTRCVGTVGIGRRTQRTDRSPANGSLPRARLPELRIQATPPAPFFGWAPRSTLIDSRPSIGAPIREARGRSQDPGGRSHPGECLQGCSFGDLRSALPSRAIRSGDPSAASFGARVAMARPLLFAVRTMEAG